MRMAGHLSAKMRLKLKFDVRGYGRTRGLLCMSTISFGTNKQDELRGECLTSGLGVCLLYWVQVQVEGHMDVVRPLVPVHLYVILLETLNNAILATVCAPNKTASPTILCRALLSSFLVIECCFGSSTATVH